ncbi:MAG: hypothetical protein GX607_02230 [Myxococcales bacterium]|jgi:hypothetical protein|nr:hypothetical protein [Myxococcales bacterium]
MELGRALDVAASLAALLSDQHDAGYAFFVYPSALMEDPQGTYYAGQLSAQPPTHPADAACIAPESGGRAPGGHRESVYATAAILYELITLRSVGPGMLPPSQLVPGAPPALDSVLSMALIADPAQRPADLKALAQALRDVKGAIGAAPVPSLLPDDGINIDVSLSLMPPTAQGQAPGHQVPSNWETPIAAAPRGPRNEVENLTALKARLEADPRPRYVVIKDGMDHGPFNAVELLQQIASHTFVGEDLVRDSVAGTEGSIADSEEFAPFAHHAHLHREQKAEKAAIERVVAQESRSTRGKAIIGIAIVGVLLAAGGTWFLTQRGARNDEIVVHEDTAANVEADAGLNVPTKKGGGGKRVVGKSGNYPLLGGGMSCEAAQNAYVEEMKMGARGQADLTAGQFQSVLGRGTYFSQCGVPSSMAINICAAVQNGRAVGVTVRTTPPSPKHQSCIAAGVRRLSFPSHPKLDVTRTSFAAQ